MVLLVSQTKSLVKKDFLHIWYSKRKAICELISPIIIGLLGIVFLNVISALLTTVSTKDPFFQQWNHSQQYEDIHYEFEDIDMHSGYTDIGRHGESIQTKWFVSPDVFSARQLVDAIDTPSSWRRKFIIGDKDYNETPYDMELITVVHNDSFQNAQKEVAALMQQATKYVGEKLDDYDNPNRDELDYSWQNRMHEPDYTSYYVDLAQRGSILTTNSSSTLEATSVSGEEASSATFTYYDVQPYSVGYRLAQASRFSSERDSNWFRETSAIARQQFDVKQRQQATFSTSSARQQKNLRRQQDASASSSEEEEEEEEEGDAAPVATSENGTTSSPATSNSGVLDMKTIITKPRSGPPADFFPLHFILPSVLFSAVIHLGFVIMAKTTVGRLVDEKQSKLREHLRMMGVRPHAYALSAMVTATVRVVFVSLSISVILIAGVGLRNDARPGWTPLLSLVIFLFGLTTAAFCHIVAAVVAKPMIATFILNLWCLLGAGASFIVTYIPSVAFQQVLACVFSPFASMYGVIGALAGPTVDFPISPIGSILIMAVQTIAYLLLGEYLYAVHPGAYGVPAHPLFPLIAIRDTLLCRSAGGHSGQGVARRRSDIYVEDGGDSPAEGGLTLSQTHSAGGGHGHGHAGNNNHQGGDRIVVRNLAKTFDNAESYAVQGLDLTLHRGEILGLLGHNGAGKTTTINMLTGMIPASQYDVCTIEGHDVGSEISAVRRSISCCPQFDILFDALSARQHLQFYQQMSGTPSSSDDAEFFGTTTTTSTSGDAHTQAAAAGMSQQKSQQQNNRIDFLLSTLQLPTDAQASHSFSGGMKRRLSVACALVGNASVVFLDEPSSGLDPVNRRQLWDLLKRQRTSGRSIVLTTHFMEEAEYLGDRIAIMSHGKLYCTGTPAQLKLEYGEGYFLTLAKAGVVVDAKNNNQQNDRRNIGEEEDNENRLRIDVAESDDGDGGKKYNGNSSNNVVFDSNAILSRILAHVPGATQHADNAGDYTALLPTNQIQNFASLLKDLEENQTALGIASIGIAMNSLEDVFVAIAEKEAKTKEAVLAEEKRKQRVLTEGAHPPRPGYNSKRNPSSSAAADADDKANLRDNIYDNHEMVPTAEDQAQEEGQPAGVAVPSSSSPVLGSVVHVDEDLEKASVAQLFDQVTAATAKSRGGVCCSPGSGLHVALTVLYKRFLTARRSPRVWMMSIFLPTLLAVAAWFAISNVDMSAGNNGDGPARLQLMGPKQKQEQRVLLAVLDDAPSEVTKEYTALVAENFRATYAQYHQEQSGSGRNSIVSQFGANLHLEMSYRDDAHLRNGTYNPLETPGLTNRNPFPIHFTLLNMQHQHDQHNRSEVETETSSTSCVVTYATGLAMEFADERSYGILMTTLFETALFKTQHDVKVAAEVGGGTKLPVITPSVAVHATQFFSIPRNSTANMDDLIPRTPGQQNDNNGGGQEKYFANPNKVYLVSLVLRLAIVFIVGSNVMSVADEMNRLIFHTMRMQGMSAGGYWLGVFLGDMIFLLPFLLASIITSATSPETNPELRTAGYVTFFAIGLLLFFLGVQVLCYAIATLVLSKTTQPTTYVTIAMAVAFLPDTVARLLNVAITEISIKLSPDSPPLNPELHSYTATGAFTDLWPSFLSQAARNPFVRDSAKDGLQLPDFLLVILCWIPLPTMALLLWNERLTLFSCCTGRKSGIANMNMTGGGFGGGGGGDNKEDPDVTAERARVETNPNDNMTYACRLRKTFNTGRLPCIPKRLHAVQDVTFGVRSGECFGLLGPNGAGKSTTCKMMLHEIAKSGGVIEYPQHNNPQARSSRWIDTLYAQARLGVCQQVITLWDDLTAEEHLVMALRFRLGWAYKTADWEGYIEKVLDAVALDNRASKTASQFSGGMKRKLQVAMAMYCGSLVSFLDEPSTGMDPFARRALWRTIQNALGGDRCVLLTTHSMDEAEAVCARIGIVTKGSLRCIGSSQHLKNKFGSGYSISIEMSSTAAQDSASVAAVVGDDKATEVWSGQLEHHMADAFGEQCKLAEAVGTHRKFAVPELLSLSKAFQILTDPAVKQQWGFENFTISQDSSLEQIFVTVTSSSSGGDSDE